MQYNWEIWEDNIRKDSKNMDSSVSIATGYGLDCEELRLGL
jgi:hypothetical protein